MKYQILSATVSIPDRKAAAQVASAIGKYPETVWQGSLEHGDYRVTFRVNRVSNVTGWVLAFNPYDQQIHAFFEASKADRIESPHRVEVFKSHKQALAYIKKHNLSFGQHITVFQEEEL